jgi:hypothetical protein
MLTRADPSNDGLTGLPVNRAIPVQSFQPVKN